MAKILVVEDEGVVALDISQELTALGHEVTGQVPSGEQAIEAVKKVRPELVFMDINLQGKMDGIEAASVISAQGIGIIFLTAHADESTLQRAKITQPFGYIIKPFESDDLRVTIELALARRGAAPASAPDESKVEELPFDVEHADGRAEALARLPLFSDIPKAQLRTLGLSGNVVQVSAGEQIVTEGDKCNSGFVVLSGRFAVLKANAGGKELILELLSNADETGLLLALTSDEAFYSVRAQIDARILSLPLGSVRPLLNDNPKLYEKLVKRLADRAHRLSDLALSLAHAKVDQRIIATLLSLAGTIGKTSGNAMNAADCRLFLTRKDLADLTGTTPETAIRVTKALERQGYLDLTRPGIIKIPSLSSLQEQLL